MRSLLVLALAIIPTPTLAWSTFEDDRFGYRIELPPGYSLSYETDQQNARFFHNADGHFIALWASAEPGSSFEGEVAEKLWADQAEGWTISYERFTSQWASYSGTKDSQIRYVRAVNLCGNGAAYFVIDYDDARKADYDPVVTRMVRSLEAIGC
ncbi:MAG: hypothetical protein MEQ84_01580 [Mesorhizobium sp.]|nr:hypothetical protein [Mesorhizobium sp.]